MNHTAIKVGEIYREAGDAFTKLSEMTLMLHSMGDPQPGGKWSEEEVEMLRSCVHEFAVDLNKLSVRIKNRTVSQIRATLKKKAFEDAGIPVRDAAPTAPPRAPQVAPLPSMLSQLTVLRNSAEVTLNMLNAPVNDENDVDGLTGDVKLEFEDSADDVDT